MRNKYLEWFCKLVAISLQNDIVEKYFMKGTSKLHLGFDSISEDDLDIQIFQQEVNN